MVLALASSIAGLIFGVQGYLEDWDGASGAMDFCGCAKRKMNGLEKCRCMNLYEFMDDLSKFCLVFWCGWL